jgi:PST family polysaccharide transporter
MFDRSAARSLLSYGFKIVGVDVVSILASNVDYLFVGRYLGSEVLGVYTLAFRLPELLIGGFARIIGNVIFPIFTHLKDTAGDVSRGFYVTTRYVSLITVPLGVGLALVARPFILVVFTDKWIEMVPIMQALAIFSTINTLTYNVGTLLKAEGYPQVITWLEFGHFLLLIPAFVWAVILAKSVIAVAWMHTLVALLLSISTILIAQKKINISWLGMFEAILPSFLPLVPMVPLVIIVLNISRQMSPWFQLVVSIISGVTIYASILWIFQRELFDDISQRLLKAVAK